MHDGRDCLVVEALRGHVPAAHAAAHAQRGVQVAGAPTQQRPNLVNVRLLEMGEGGGLASGQCCRQ